MGGVAWGIEENRKEGMSGDLPCLTCHRSPLLPALSPPPPPSPTTLQSSAMSCGHPAAEPVAAVRTAAQPQGPLRAPPG